MKLVDKILPIVIMYHGSRLSTLFHPENIAQFCFPSPCRAYVRVRPYLSNFAVLFDRVFINF